MKKLVLPLIGAVALATGVHAQGREDTAVAAFQSICLSTGGNLEDSIAKLEASDSFGDARQSGSGSFRHTSYTGADGINASVLIGSSVSDDKCTIIMMNTPEPMQQADALATGLADSVGAELMQWEGFGDYGKGGYGYQTGDGDVVIAPVTTGISDDILHLTFYPT